MSMFFRISEQTIVIEDLVPSETYEVWVQANTSSHKIGKSKSVYETMFEQLNILRYISELHHVVSYEWLAPHHNQVKRHQLEYFVRYTLWFFSGYHQITHSRFSNIPSKLFLIPEQPALTQANQVYDFKLSNLTPGKTYNVRIRAAFVSRTGIVTEYTWPKNMVNVNLW